MNIDEHIRRVPNFPKPGINFYDITSILVEPAAFGYVIDQMEEYCRDKHIDCIVPAESRGFLFAAPLADRLGIPMVPARKKGKLPGDVIARSYDLEYGTATMELHCHDLKAGTKALVVDDLIATGGTLTAICGMIEELGGEVCGIYGIVGLPFLNYERVLAKYEIKTLINYDSE